MAAAEPIQRLQQDGFWNPRYEEPRVRASTISTRPAGGGGSSGGGTYNADDASSPGQPLPKPRRAMSVSCRDKRPHPLPRLLSRIEQKEEEEESLPEVDSTYSTPYAAATAVGDTAATRAFSRRNSAKAPESVAATAHRSRVSSVSSTTSSLSSTSSSPSSSPASPQLTSLSPEQFWAKYRRSTGAEPRKFRSLFSTLSLADPPLLLASPAEPLSAGPEPLYSEIYGAVRPPLPRKNSVSKPPARPPPPADLQPVKQVARPAADSPDDQKDKIPQAVTPARDKPRTRPSGRLATGVPNKGKGPAR